MRDASTRKVPGKLKNGVLEVFLTGPNSDMQHAWENSV